jgi:transposase
MRFMFLRPNHRHKDGKEHVYWSLVETVRTPDGPRQRTLCYLGELNHSAQARWLKTLEVFNEQGECRQLKLFPSEVEPPENDAQVARVLVRKVRFERVRQFGQCFLGWQLWQRLQLDRLWEEQLDGEVAEVPWSRVAAVLAINRLCAPGSELGIEERWYPATALEEMLRIPAGTINHTRLYRCLDRLIPHKAEMERHLKQRYGELFAAEFDVLLYDLTSSYVEGEAGKNPLMQRGYSRDHRPDCKQVVIALIVNVEGFPLSYETLDGDRSDVTTLEVLMRMVERKYGRARRVWVFDRGIVSEANLEALRRRGGQYLVGTPRSKLKEFEKALLEGDWKQIQDEVEVKLVSLPDTTETYVLCRSSSRREKEKAIRRRFSQRLEQALGRLHQRIAQGRLKDPTKIQQALARLRVGHSRVADLYQVRLVEREGTVQLEWQLMEERLAWRETREGAYLLRTNLSGESAGELWKKYIQLTEAEAAFRALKSALLIRPLFHQLERRVKAHILVAFLGYALWVTLKHLLQRKDSRLSPAQALALLSTLQSADIVLPTTDGREIRLRRVSAPDPKQQQLLDQLGLIVPQDLELNFECSVDSALA